MKTLLEKLIQEEIALFLEREQDPVMLKKAMNSYVTLKNYLKGLQGKDLKTFKKGVKALDGGTPGVIDMEKVAPREEHEGLVVQFKERTEWNIGGGVEAQAFDERVQQGGVGFTIEIYYEVPDKTLLDKKHKEEYHKWISENIYSIFQKRRIDYVHEFIHTLDYRRLKAKPKKFWKTQKDLDLSKPGEYAKYINDPLELNAYFQQTVAGISAALKNQEDKSEANIKSIIGNNPREFVEKFMGRDLAKNVSNYLSPENVKRFMKRAADVYQQLLDQYVEKEWSFGL